MLPTIVLLSFYRTCASAQNDPMTEFQTRFGEWEATVAFSPERDVSERRLESILSSMSPAERVQLFTYLANLACGNAPAHVKTQSQYYFGPLVKSGDVDATARAQAVVCYRDLILDESIDVFVRLPYITALLRLGPGSDIVAALVMIRNAAEADGFVGGGLISRDALQALGACGSAGADVILGMTAEYGIKEWILISLARTGDPRAYDVLQQWIAQKNCDFTQRQCGTVVAALGNLGAGIARDPAPSAEATTMLEAIRAQLHGWCDLTLEPGTVGLAAVGLARITPPADQTTVSMLEALVPGLDASYGEQVTRALSDQAGG